MVSTADPVASLSVLPAGLSRYSVAYVELQGSRDGIDDLCGRVGVTALFKT